jgi:hypothetical protein
VEGLGLCAKICIHSRWLSQADAGARGEDVEALAHWLVQLRGYAHRVQALADDSRIPHQRVMLMDPRRALDILREGEETLRRIRLASPQA